MTQRAEAKFTGFLDQAVQAFGDTLRAGVKFQEEMSKWWTDVALENRMPVQDWPRKSRAILNEAIPAAQKNAEEWLKIFEQNYKRSSELVKKALNSENGETSKDLRSKLQELWEGTLDALRDNTQAMTEANLKLMETWAEVVRRNMGAEEPVAAK